MAQSLSNLVGVCSWSLEPKTPEDLVERLRACRVRAVQLALDPIGAFRWRADETSSRLRAAGIRIASGMVGCKGEDYSTLETIRQTGGIRPDATWDDNRKAAEHNAIVAQRFGVHLVTLHAGFLPHESSDPERVKMLDRLAELASIFAARHVRLGLETGQESADTLLGVLGELHARGGAAASVGVNFDPANMILYAMGDPVAALRKLAPHVVQIHIKDALPTSKPGEWGSEVPAGKGAVDWPAFFAVVRQTGLLTRGVPFMVEREAGSDRVNDLRAGAELALAMLEQPQLA
ncbi:MAG: sugar phosphate isomerase/epimerase family protein [Planctomycetota bacterium]|nr:sugar phosphate isomerase/epimerase family protein [Planctomycetota bacterium]